MGFKLIICYSSLLISFYLPGDPLAAIYAKMAAVGGSMGSEELIQEYRSRFGLDKSQFEQYISSRRQLFRGDLGYSIASFPTRVSFVLWQAIPLTVGLLTVTTLISWILGSLLGALVGWSDGKSRLLNTMVPIALVLYTTPYYILAIMLVFLAFAYRWAVFPLSGAYRRRDDDAVRLARRIDLPGKAAALLPGGIPLLFDVTRFVAL